MHLRILKFLIGNLKRYWPWPEKREFGYIITLYDPSHSIKRLEQRDFFDGYSDFLDALGPSRFSIYKSIYEKEETLEHLLLLQEKDSTKDNFQYENNMEYDGIIFQKSVQKTINVYRLGIINSQLKLFREVSPWSSILILEERIVRLPFFFSISILKDILSLAENFYLMTYDPSFIFCQESLIIRVNNLDSCSDIEMESKRNNAFRIILVKNISKSEYMYEIYFTHSTSLKRAFALFTILGYQTIINENGYGIRDDQEKKRDKLFYHILHGQLCYFSCPPSLESYEKLKVFRGNYRLNDPSLIKVTTGPYKHDILEELRGFIIYQSLISSSPLISVDIQKTTTNEEFEITWRLLKNSRHSIKLIPILSQLGSYYQKLLTATYTLVFKTKEWNHKIDSVDLVIAKRFLSVSVEMAKKSRGHICFFFWTNWKKLYPTAQIATRTFLIDSFEEFVEFFEKMLEIVYSPYFMNFIQPGLAITATNSSNNNKIKVELRFDPTLATMADFENELWILNEKYTNIHPLQFNDNDSFKIHGTRDYVRATIKSISLDYSIVSTCFDVYKDLFKAMEFPRAISNFVHVSFDWNSGESAINVGNDMTMKIPYRDSKDLGSLKMILAESMFKDGIFGSIWDFDGCVYVRALRHQLAANSKKIIPLIMTIMIKRMTEILGDYYQNGFITTRQFFDKNDQKMTLFQQQNINCRIIDLTKWYLKKQENPFTTSKLYFYRLKDEHYPSRGPLITIIFNFLNNTPTMNAFIKEIWKMINTSPLTCGISRMVVNRELKHFFVILQSTKYLHALKKSFTSFGKDKNVNIRVHEDDNGELAVKDNMIFFNKLKRATEVNKDGWSLWNLNMIT